MKFCDLSPTPSVKQCLDSFLYLQNYMLEKNEKNEPFFIGSFPGNEANLCGNVITNKPSSDWLRNQMLNNAGINFINPDEVITYVKLYTQSLINSSILAAFSVTNQSEDLCIWLDKYIPNQKRIFAKAIEPFYFMDHPDYHYNDIFVNKKVLLITSHYETTKQQISKNAKIFNKPIFDESTEFHIYKPPQQHCGNNDSNSWIFHYEKMKNDLIELKKTFDFDIALLSCGGFGMLMSDFIYSDLKTSVMYIGGGLQIYFGIMGNRWENHPIISKFQNDNWTSVLDCDKPKTLIHNSEICENNCYW
jgi:hypothetical protein